MNESLNKSDVRTSLTLMQAMRSDDPAKQRQAQDRFFRIYAPIISRFVRRYGTQSADVDDLVQTVVMAVLRAKNFEYNPESGQFRSYLKKAAANAMRRLWRKQSRDPRTEIDSEEVEVEATWRDFWEEEMLRTALTEVRAAYQKQKAPTFEAFWRVAMLGQEPKIVSDDLGISLESVYAARSRIQNALKKCLQLLNSGML